MRCVAIGPLLLAERIDGHLSWHGLTVAARRGADVYFADARTLAIPLKHWQDAPINSAASRFTPCHEALDSFSYQHYRLA